MNEKKYILTEETKNILGHTLHRIQAVKDFGDVKAGDLGGWIESEENLSQEGTCWVYNEAEVCDKARVYDEARVYNKARVYSEAWIFNKACVYGEAWIFNKACVFGEAEVYGKARVYGEAEVFGKARVGGEANIFGKARVSGEAIVCGKVHLSGEVKITNEIRKFQISQEDSAQGKILRHREICAKLSELYEKKNHDYGDSFHETFLEEGWAMPRIRLGDKFRRFCSLTNSSDSPMVKDESIRDTLLDLANYAILTVLEMDGGTE